MGQEDFAQTVSISTANVERKKYDPVYEIWIDMGGKTVRYIGRIQSFTMNSNILTVKGVSLTPSETKKETPEKLEMLEKETQTEDSFPVVNFKLIRKLA